MPSISSSVIDPNKSLDNSIQESLQNDRDSSDDDDNDNDDENSTSVVNRSTTTTKTATPDKAKSTGVGNKKSAPQTPKRVASKRNPTNASKDSPDENENCRVRNLAWWMVYVLTQIMCR